MPRWSQELPLRRLSLFLLLILLAPGPGLLRAQEPGDSTSLGPVPGFLGLSVGLTRLRGETKPLLGATALVELSPRWRAGGAAYVLPGKLSFGEGVADISYLRLGYGGLLVEWKFPDDSQAEHRGGRVTMLVGAGNAELDQTTLGIRLQSDNFLVLEPGATLETTLIRRLSLEASARYRAALSVQDLDGIDERELSGIVLALTLRLGPL